MCLPAAEQDKAIDFYLYLKLIVTNITVGIRQVYIVCDRLYKLDIFVFVRIYAYSCLFYKSNTVK